jgi:dicarboxylate transporter 10
MTGMLMDDLFGRRWNGQVRAILMNASQLASYDVFKKLLLSIKGSRDGPILQFGASFLAGTVATSESKEKKGSTGKMYDSAYVNWPRTTAICAPADVVKSRVMAAKGGASIPTIISTAVKQEGLKFFFRGWTAAW